MRRVANSAVKRPFDLLHRNILESNSSSNNCNCNCETHRARHFIEQVEGVDERPPPPPPLLTLPSPSPLASRYQRLLSSPSPSYIELLHPPPPAASCCLLLPPLLRGPGHTFCGAISSFEACTNTSRNPRPRRFLLSLSLSLSHSLVLPFRQVLFGFHSR